MGVLDVPGYSRAQTDAAIVAAGGVTLRAQNDQDEKRNMALRRFRVGMAGIDSAPVVIFTETDSIGEGYNLGAGGAWNKTDRPMDRLLAELNRRLAVTGAPGAGPYVPVRMASSVGPATGWPWTLSGSPALSLDSMGPGLRTNIVSGTQYVEYAALGITKFRVFYGKGPLAGTLRIRLDGTVVTTIAVNDVSVNTDGFFYDVAIPDTSAHAVRLEASAGAVFVHGGMPLNGNDTKGWQIIEGGHSSAGSKVFVASTPNDARKVRRDQIAAAQPHLYYLELGANDFANDSQKLTAAAFKTNVQAMIADARTASTTKPSIVLGAAWELNAAITPLSPWKDYRAALYDIAAGDADIVVFDMAQRVRTAPPLDNARGLLSDLTHLSTAGSRAWARDFAQFLLA